MSGVIYIIEYWKRLFKGERNQLMIWRFTEFRTNKKNENMTFFNENFTRVDVKALLYLIDILLILNFPLNMQAAIFPLSVT
jgi:hypothetical protein